MPNPTPGETFADSTSLLKEDPGVFDAMLNPAPVGTASARRLKTLSSLARKITPSSKAPSRDPIGDLQRSITTILMGAGGRGVCLSSVVELTNRQCPLTKAYFCLRDILAAITNVAERRQGADYFTDWSPAQLEALGEAPRGPAQGMAYIGYKVDAPRVRSAISELRCIEQQVGSADARHTVVSAVLSLVSQTLLQMKRELEWAAEDWLELIADREQPGRFTIRAIPAPRAAGSTEADESGAECLDTCHRQIAEETARG